MASLPGGGKVTVNLNRTRTVAAILESAMNKEEGQEERLSEHQFPNWLFVTEMNFISYDC